VHRYGGGRTGRDSRIYRFRLAAVFLAGVGLADRFSTLDLGNLLEVLGLATAFLTRVGATDFFAEADLTFDTSPAFAPATPPTTAPTAAPSGPNNDPTAAPAAAPAAAPVPAFPTVPKAELVSFGIVPAFLTIPIPLIKFVAIRLSHRMTRILASLTEFNQVVLDQIADGHVRKDEFS
jgi:hypothetical protein